MPAISHLNGSRKRLARGFGVDATAVTTHDLRVRMLSQPPGYGLGLTIGSRSITLRFSRSQRIVP